MVQNWYFNYFTSQNKIEVCDLRTKSNERCSVILLAFDSLRFITHCLSDARTFSLQRWHRASETLCDIYMLLIARSRFLQQSSVLFKVLGMVNDLLKNKAGPAIIMLCLTKPQNRRETFHWPHFTDV